MNKYKMIILILSALILGVYIAAQAADNEPQSFDPPEDGLEINFIQGHSKEDHSVEFNHSSHEGFDCIDCHHKMDELKGQAPPRSCASCHDNFSPDDLKGWNSYFKAMHKIRFAPNADRPSCLNCHTNEFGADDKEYTGCNSSACHPSGIR